MLSPALEPNPYIEVENGEGRLKAPEGTLLPRYTLIFLKSDTMESLSFPPADGGGSRWQEGIWKVFHDGGPLFEDIQAKRKASD